MPVNLSNALQHRLALSRQGIDCAALQLVGFPCGYGNHLWVSLVFHSLVIVDHQISLLDYRSGSAEDAVLGLVLPSPLSPSSSRSK